jgi:signal transduction histidine kinase
MTSRPQETLQRAQETIQQLHRELEQTNREVMALTLELEQRVDRLKLLNQITRAISERQDLHSILQVAVRSLEEHLPLDFACVCLHEPGDGFVTVVSVGSHEPALATGLALPERARIDVDANGLSRCLRGELVYHPDTAALAQPFPERLARAGVHALVMAPLRAENTVFGVLVATRRKANSVSTDELEFIRQLSEQVALAAHQATLYSALERAYEDLRRTQETVAQQERLRALGQMAGGIAHDINNALSPAALYAQALLEHEASLSEEARESLTIIHQAIADVGRTVARLRMFFRPRESELAFTAIDLNVLVRQVTDLTRPRWSDIPQERGLVVDVTSDLAPDVPPIMGAEHEIRDALTNLVLNAVDAMPSGGALTVRTRLVPAEQRITLEVSDSGIGMTDEVRLRCLEPFFTTKGERGTGLGLAMVYGMAERHGAALEIDSAPGQGTTMRLLFPAATPSAVIEPVTHSSPVTPLRLLVIDDDPLLLRSLSNVLAADGHAVTAADGGQKGIDAFAAALARGEPFAAVITDLGMPNIDGRTVAAAIKALAPMTPVILLTGWGQRAQGDDERPHHVDHVLDKPPSLAKLRDALR